MEDNPVTGTREKKQNCFGQPVSIVQNVYRALYKRKAKNCKNNKLQDYKILMLLNCVDISETVNLILN